jgi:hypothetical protein
MAVRNPKKAEKFWEYRGIITSIPRGFSLRTVENTLYTTAFYPSRDEAVRAVSNWLAMSENSNMINQWVN